MSKGKGRHAWLSRRKHKPPHEQREQPGKRSGTPPKPRKLSGVIEWNSDAPVAERSTGT